ncbi:putative transcriptional regulatory protein C1F7.11c [Grifola frondosa]|uniref:Putative transcriptional regulatory protein C1F7.11c n=1 Tax=Grifola frondosa TaxID=5627 RepID=A0A1C7MIX3_GRIFR|nr:putative transcriptional regulatory protein C1F7.11c [Grifola frondosa]
MRRQARDESDAVLSLPTLSLLARLAFTFADNPRLVDSALLLCDSTLLPRPPCRSPPAPARTTRTAQQRHRSRSSSAQEVPYLAQNAAGSNSSATRPSPAPHASAEAAPPSVPMAALPQVGVQSVLERYGVECVVLQGLVAEEHSIESTWALMGLSSKLAQSIGLHRDCARFQLSTAEVQKRRGLFWELFITDCWQALATGRLPTFSLQFVDTELAGDPDQTLEEDGSVQPSFPAWKARWGKECVSPIVMGTLTSQAPRYAVILELDRRIRDMPLPKYAQGAAPRGAGLAQTMSHYMPINYLHLTLLYVHRCFFAQALSQHPTDPMRSQYAPSFLAGYRSACALLSTVREQFMLFPVQIARFWVLWTHAFSSSVMLASVVTHGGTTKTAQAALGELRLACDLFERAATHGGRAVKFLPILRRLQDKAQQAHFKGLQPLRHDIFTPRNAQSDAPDELSIFSGRTRTVATKAHKPRARSESRRRISPGTSSSSGGSAAPTPPDSAGSGAGSSPGSGAEVFPMVEPAARARVHPRLVDEMRAWQGQLDAQIAYCRGEGAGVEMETPFAYQASGGEGWYAEPEQEGVSPHQQLQHRQQEHPQRHQQQQQHQQQHRQQQQQQHPQQHHYQQQEYLQALQPHPSHSMQAQAPPVRAHPVQAQHPVQTSQPVHATMHATTESQAHSLPVYGAVDPGPPADASYHPYAAPPPSAAHEYHAEYEYEYTHAPAHHANANVRSELWAVPPQAQESALLYGTSPEFQQLVEEQYGLKHGHGHGQQMQMQMMPPPPPPHVLPVYTGGYSLQESWTSFMQNELPTPVQSSHGRR